MSDQATIRRLSGEHSKALRAWLSARGDTEAAATLAALNKARQRLLEAKYGPGAT